MSFGIVIPNRYPDIIVPLAGSLKRCASADVRIIIVADGHCNNYGFESIAYEDDHFSFSRAVNIGIRTLGQQDVVIMHDDCVAIEPDTFRELERVAYFSQDIGILSPLIKGCVGNPIQRWHERERYWLANDDLRFVGGSDPVGFPCVYVKRNVFEKVGLLNENLDGDRGEDVEFCMRCRKAGFLTAVTSRVTIQHGDGGTELGEGWGKTWSLSFARRSRETEKHGPEKPVKPVCCPALSPEEKTFVDQFEDPWVVEAAADFSQPPEAGFVGRNPILGRMPVAVRGRVKSPGKQHRYKVVTMFTRDNEYATHARRLEATLKSFGVTYLAQPIEDDSVWELICARKANFIREQWLSSDVPIVWIDADATIEARPDLFETIEADFAVHKFQGWEFASGTLYFGKSETAGMLLDQWVLRCEADPLTWDQRHLQSAWCDVTVAAPLRTFWLPASYLHIFDVPSDSPPVIKHWMASLKAKADGRTSGTQQLEITDAGIEARRANRLWRTPEESSWFGPGKTYRKSEIVSASAASSVFRELLGNFYPVLEIGCAEEGSASQFQPHEYVGVNLDPYALLQARRSFPMHQFRLYDHGYSYPATPSAIVCNVLMRVPDEHVLGFLRQAVLGRKRFLIAEVMDDRERAEATLFHRNPEDYILAMNKLGFRLFAARKIAVDRQSAGARWTCLAFDTDSHG